MVRTKSAIPVKDRKINGGEEAGWMVQCKSSVKFKVGPAPEDRYFYMQIRSQKGAMLVRRRGKTPISKVKKIFSKKKGVPSGTFLFRQGGVAIDDDNATLASLGFGKRCVISVEFQDPAANEPEEDGEHDN